MPRALTEQEKCRLCNRLLEKGKAVVLTQGIRKVSVDDITKAAGMAKGSFYQHFESKEKYLFALVEDVTRQIFAQAEQMILGVDDIRASLRGFLTDLFQMPEMTFFAKNFHEIAALFDPELNPDAQSALQSETVMFEKLLQLMGIDIQKVRPGVVHNYMHILSWMQGSDCIVRDDLSQTFDVLMDSLAAYLAGGGV